MVDHEEKQNEQLNDLPPQAAPLDTEADTPEFDQIDPADEQASLPTAEGEGEAGAEGECDCLETDDKRFLRLLEALNEKLENISLSLGIPHKFSKRKLIFRSFLSGVARGIGYAVGFAVFGALLISLLTYLAEKNVPVIGRFIADIIRIVEGSMR